MSLDDESRRIVLDYLGYHLGYKLSSVDNLKQLSAADLLALLGRVKSEALPFVMQLIKEAPEDWGLFQKLMGDHDPDLWEKSQDFFNRYSAVMMEEIEEEYNPLLIYLPPESWHDLAFLQSRESFFLRQSLENIVDFLQFHFEELPDFGPDGSLKAWNWFFNKVVLG